MRALAMLLVVVATACSAKHRAGQPAAAGTPAAGTSGEAGGAGRASVEPRAGGGGVEGGAGSAPPLLDVVVNVAAERDDDPNGPHAVCPDECVLLMAEAKGGRAPYSFEWDDSSLSGAGPHRVCPDQSAKYTVRVTDTPREDDEFTRPPAEGSGTVEIVVEPCPQEPDGCEPKPVDDDYAFEPIPKWSWGEDAYILASPLVANLTDDNGDGKKDVQDVPDVVVVPYFEGGDTEAAHPALVVLDGATGREHARIHNAWHDNAPALGDLDGDTVPEIVMVQMFLTDPFDPSAGPRVLAALDGHGRRKWAAVFETPYNRQHGPTAIAIADLDQDGRPEVIAWPEVFNANGEPVFAIGGGPSEDTILTSPVPVDLDGDGKLEIVVGGDAYRHDGSSFFSNAEVKAVTDEKLGSAFNAVADLNGDGAPEIVVTTHRRTFVLGADGRTLHAIDNMHPSAFPFPPAIASPRAGEPPAIFVSDGQLLAAYSAKLAPIWSAIASDVGSSAPTVFDFEGDGRAEVVYGDDSRLWVLTADRGEILQIIPRVSLTLIDYPVIADVDSDGSADLVVVTSGQEGQTLPALTVLSDPEKRWMPARRIFNQDAYSVTNVNEDGTIPIRPLGSWLLNNSFRAQAYRGRDGAVCVPKGKTAEP